MRIILLSETAQQFERYHEQYNTDAGSRKGAG